MSGRSGNKSDDTGNVVYRHEGTAACGYNKQRHCVTGLRFFEVCASRLLQADFHLALHSVIAVHELLDSVGVINTSGA